MQVQALDLVGVFKKRRPAAVLAVTQDWMTDHGTVHAELVGPAGARAEHSNLNTVNGFAVSVADDVTLAGLIERTLLIEFDALAIKRADRLIPTH